jgi:hypothetical protein
MISLLRLGGEKVVRGTPPRDRRTIGDRALEVNASFQKISGDLSEKGVDLERERADTPRVEGMSPRPNQRTKP